MNVSPSQLATQLECNRKRWFGSFIRLPDHKDKTKQAVGTALHNVAERWLKADDSGRGPDGNPVDLYPQDWDLVVEREKKIRLSPRDAAVVRKLIRDGMDSGTLRKLPDREVEIDYQRVVVTVDGVEILMRGRIDQRNKGIIEDHKSSGSRDWCLTRETLRTDPKMLCYAAEHFFTYPDLDSLVMRLNYFIKDPRVVPNTFAVECVVGRAEVMAFWEDLVVPEVKLMLQWEQAAPTIDRWREVPGPNVPGACEAYGGCPYARICSGLEREPMGVFDKNKKPAASQPAPTAPAAVASPAPTAAANPPAPNPQATSAEGPPWRQPGCMACKGTGVSSKGNPCAACKHVWERLTPNRVDSYKTWVSEDGTFRWALVEGVKLPGPGDRADNPKVPPDSPKTGETPAPAAPPVETRLPSESPVSAPPDAPPSMSAAPEGTEAVPKKRGRKTKEEKFRELAEIEDGCPIGVGGLMMDLKMDSRKPTLYIDCIPVGVSVTMDVGMFLLSEGQELAKAFRVNSYFEVDAFKRRDALASQAGALIAALPPGAHIVCVDQTPDVRSLLAAIRAEVVKMGGIVVQGVR